MKRNKIVLVFILFIFVLIHHFLHFDEEKPKETVPSSSNQGDYQKCDG